MSFGEDLSSRRHFMKPAILGLGLVALGVVTGLNRPSTAADTAGRAAPDLTPMRVGVYDSHAVAIAYYHSEQWRAELLKRQAEYAQANAAGDRQRMAAIEKQGREAQELAQRQTFGDASIKNILATMTNALAQIRTKANVGSIVAGDVREYSSTNAVDVTSLMLEPFHPTSETMKVIEAVKKQRPLHPNGSPAKQ